MSSNVPTPPAPHVPDVAAMATTAHEFLRSILDPIPRSVYCLDVSPAHRVSSSSPKKRVDKTAAVAAELTRQNEANRARRRARAASNRLSAKKGKARTIGIDGHVVDHGPPAARLQEKLRALREARRADDPEAVARRAAKKRRHEESGDVEREDGEGGGGVDTGLRRKRAKKEKRRKGGENGTEKRVMSPGVESSGQSSRRTEQEIVPEVQSSGKRKAPAIELPEVKGLSDYQSKGDGGRGQKRRAGKRIDKVSHLESMRDKLLQEQETREHIRTSGSTDGAEAIRRLEMDKALQRAQGVTVKDQASRLQKTIRREKRKKEKSRENWEKRAQGVVADKEAKQIRREERLRERKEGKSVKKVGKSSKKAMPGS